MEFEFKTVSTPDTLTLTLTGRLDTLSASELDREVKVINANPAPLLTVDISGLTYISSSGLRCFAELLKGTRKAGTRMVITGMQPAIREIFDLTGFSKLFDVQ